MPFQPALPKSPTPCSGCVARANVLRSLGGDYGQAQTRRWRCDGDESKTTNKKKQKKTLGELTAHGLHRLPVAEQRELMPTVDPASVSDALANPPSTST